MIDATDEQALLSLWRTKPYTKAVSNMAIMDIADVTKLFRCVNELLAEGGIFVFATQHPCFVTLTEIYSQLADYYSFGIAVDVAGTYTTKDDLFTASLIGRNIGAQIVPYRTGEREPLPFELQIGLSQRLRHIPVRFSQLITHLERWDLSYTDRSRRRCGPG